MLLLLLIIILSLIVVKVVKLSQFWVSYGITYEAFPTYLYRVMWRYNTRVVAEVLREDAKRYGPIYGSYRGLKPALIVSDMEVAKEVLIKQFNNFFNRSTEFCTGDPLWDNILMNMPYEQWKSLRTVMSCTFTASKMRGMIPKFDNVSKRLLKKFERIARSPEGTVVLKNDIKAYAIDSMTVVSFGLDPNAIEDQDSSFRKNAAELLKPGLSMMLFYLAPNIMKYLPGIDFPPAHVSKFFGTVGNHSLTEKRKKLDQVIANGTADILDLHLIAQRDDPKLLTDEMLASSAFLFLIAALDGITITVEFTCYYLAIYPEIQNRVYDEIISVLEERTEVQYEDVLQMKYVEACLLETLRYAPIVPLFDRICTADTKVNGIDIKKGMLIEFPVPAIHMDPVNFPEPERFFLDRFLKNREDQDISAFLMFGAGPKNCIGKRLAVMNMQTLLANLLIKVRLERSSETPYPLEVKTGLRFSNFEKKPLALKLVPR